MLQFITNLKVYDNIMKEPAQFISNLAGVKSSKFEISFAVPAINLENLARLFPGKIKAQHVDLNPPGPYTGSIPMEALLTYEINGSLLNHSEKRIQSETIMAYPIFIGFSLAPTTATDLGLTSCSNTHVKRNKYY